MQSYKLATAQTGNMLYAEQLAKRTEALAAALLGDRPPEPRMATGTEPVLDEGLFGEMAVRSRAITEAHVRLSDALGRLEDFLDGERPSDAKKAC